MHVSEEEIQEIIKTEKESWENALSLTVEQRVERCYLDTSKITLPYSYMSWNSMEEYRAWCDKNLPTWLGKGNTL
jgi:hypothetical protein